MRSTARLPPSKPCSTTAQHSTARHGTARHSVLTAIHGLPVGLRRPGGSSPPLRPPLPPFLGTTTGGNPRGRGPTAEPAPAAGRAAAASAASAAYRMGSSSGPSCSCSPSVPGSCFTCACSSRCCRLPSCPSPSFSEPSGLAVERRIQRSWRLCLPEPPLGCSWPGAPPPTPPPLLAPPPWWPLPPGRGASGDTASSAWSTSMRCACCTCCACCASGSGSMRRCFWRCGASGPPSSSDKLSSTACSSASSSVSGSC